MAEPPSYEAASVVNSRAQLQDNDLPTFNLDGTLVFPSDPPSTAMYQLNSDPCTARSHVFELRRLKYRLSSNDGEGSIRQSRSDVLYDMRPSRVPHYLYIGGRTQVLVLGKASGHVSFGEATMLPGWSTASWKIPGHFRTSLGLFDRLSGDSEIKWLDWDSRAVVAVEKSSGRGEGKAKGSTVRRLELKVKLDNKRRDLLVACWVARLWRESASG